MNQSRTVRFACRRHCSVSDGSELYQVLHVPHSPVPGQVFLCLQVMGVWCKLCKPAEPRSVIYIFSIALTQLSEGTPLGTAYFPTLVDGMSCSQNH